jgi:hypothetical protein
VSNNSAAKSRLQRRHMASTPPMTPQEFNNRMKEAHTIGDVDD